MNGIARSSRKMGARLLGAAMAFAFSPSPHAADAGYLSALKAEAESGGPAQGKAVRGGDLGDFETWLSGKYAGSYAFYSKLNDNEKDAVFRAYRAGEGIDALRDRIRDLLRN